MSWHFQITTVTGRRYPPGTSYAQRSKYATTLQIFLPGDGSAYVHGMLNDGTKGEVLEDDWIELRDKLRELFKVTVVESERHRRKKSHPTGPATLG